MSALIPWLLAAVAALALMAFIGRELWVWYVLARRGLRAQASVQSVASTKSGLSVVYSFSPIGEAEARLCCRGWVPRTMKDTVFPGAVIGIRYAQGGPWLSRIEHMGHIGWGLRPYAGPK